jgi:TolB-like protein
MDKEKLRPFVLSTLGSPKCGREQDYFVDGATESLTTNLSRISDVRMIRIAITAEAFTAPTMQKGPT